jgi:hypothetical protein
VEFFHFHSGVENRPGARLRQLRRPEAGRSGPGNCSPLGRHRRQGGIAPGVFNLVMGRGSTVGQALLENKDVAAVSFIGSVATGRRIAQSLAGKNPMIVLDDADLKTAVDCAVNGAFLFDWPALHRDGHLLAQLHHRRIPRSSFTIAC